MIGRQSTVRRRREDRRLATEADTFTGVCCTGKLAVLAAHIDARCVGRVLPLPCSDPPFSAASGLSLHFVALLFVGLASTTLQMPIMLQLFEQAPATSERCISEQTLGLFVMMGRSLIYSPSPHCLSQVRF